MKFVSMATAKKSKASASTQEKKDLARLFFITDNLTQKEIAKRVDVNEKTIGSWVRDGQWQKLRTSLLTSKGDLLRRYYKILDAVADKIEKTEGGYGDTKLADMSIKYSAAVKNLETETSAGQMFETGMAFIRHVMKDDTELAKAITDQFDAFILSELNAKF